MKREMGGTIRTTRTRCVPCNTWLDARLVERAGDVYLESDCPACGPRRAFFKSDDSFYRAYGAFDTPAALPQAVSPSLSPRVNEVYVDVTSRCNLDCAVCFAASGKDKPAQERPLDEILDDLRRIRGRKPILSVLGGEPTLREDLPVLIREATAMGFHIKLDTNGIRLADEGYMDLLVKSGLRTLCLQFDGFDADVYRVIRGADLLQTKQRVLDLATQRRLNIILACMIVPGGNQSQIRPILDYALANPQVSLVGYLPSANIGRNAIEGETRSYDLVEFVRDLDEATDGGIARSDFLESMRWARLLGKLGGSADFHTTSCFVGTYLLRRNGDYVPVPRLRRFRALATRPWALRLVGQLAAVARGRRRCATRPGVLGVVVETYLCQDRLDEVGALQCPKAYLTSDGYVPVCLFNAVGRNQATSNL